MNELPASASAVSAGSPKITAVETSVVSVPFEMGGPHQLFAGRPWHRMETLLVRVETEDGLVGWGEAFGHAAISSTRKALDEVVAPLVIGRDAGDIAELGPKLLHTVHLLGRNGPFAYAVGGIEMALWDILGKRCGQPVWRLLGGSVPGTLRAYASLLNYEDDEVVAKNTAAASDAGYRHIKLHQTTSASVDAARRAAPEAEIMLDVNCAWSPPRAREMVEELRGRGLFWLEEPVWPPEDMASLAELRRRGIPISTGENVAGLSGFKSLIDAEAIDIAQPSVTKLGGIGEMVRIIHLCQANGVEVAPHSPYFGPGLVATLHVAAAIVERPLIEVLWVEMKESPFDPWIRPVDGALRVPHGPGLGCDPDPDLLRRCTRGEPTRIEAGVGA